MLAPPLAPGKFADPFTTRDGSPRASVPFTALKTLWINTGTLCNIECKACYIDSSPTNDRLAYLARAEAKAFFDEAAAMGAEEIGFTGGEPFMNPDMAGMAEDALALGFSVLILTNAMRPAMRPPVRGAIRQLARDHGGSLTLRVSLDHHTAHHHDEERGEGSFDIALEGLKAFAADGVRLAVAGRMRWNESVADAREGYRALFAAHALAIDADDPAALVLFPEMDQRLDTPEITEACWSLLKKAPESIMCASSRMVIKRKGRAPSVVACTLIVDDPQFELGPTLADAARPVRLNHPHCSRFCVLGGASCSA
jgi:sulfatase maturation enzyme AslB (radical SAM superfamily)